MKTAATILSLCWLANALPASESTALHPRAHPESPFTTHLQRRAGLCSGHSCALTDNAINTESPKFLTEITLGKQSFLVEVDTGSANLWLIESGFKCYPDGTEVLKTTTKTKTAPEKLCNFGPAWKPDASFKRIPDVLDYVTYGIPGEAARDLTGALGYHAVSFAGFDISKALVGAMNKSSFPAQGKPIQSGILGMGFSDLTLAIQLPKGNTFAYNSTMEILFSEQPKLPKMFSMVISRDRSKKGYGGSLTIGGLANLTIPTVNVSSQTPASAPFLATNVNGTALQTNGTYAFYLINVTSFNVAGASYDADTTVLIDSGTPNVMVPPTTAAAFNGAWSPAANFSKEQDGWVIDCDAKNSMGFGVTIDGTLFNVNPVDLIAPINKTTCISTIAMANSTRPGTYILGDVFMRNAVSVFDWANLTASFYPREYYKS